MNDGNVRIFKKDIFSKGAFVKYSKRDKLMEISGFPEIDNQGSKYSAKKIIIDVDKNTFLLEGGLEATILNETVDEKKDNNSIDIWEDKREFETDNTDDNIINKDEKSNE